jgi:hypothetical protein
LKLLGSDLGLGVNGAKQRDFFDFFRVDKSLPFTEAERDLGSWAKAPVGQNVSWRGACIQRGLLRPGGPAPKGLKDIDGALIVPIVVLVLVLVLVIDFENHTKATLEPFPRLRDERTSSISCRDLF